MALYGDRCRVESTRLKGWDYAKRGGYFVTGSKQGRDCIFGEVIEGRPRLSNIGKVRQTGVLRQPVTSLDAAHRARPTNRRRAGAKKDPSGPLARECGLCY